MSKNPVPSVQLHTPAGAGERLGCSDDTVMRIVASGELRVVDIAPPGSKRSKTRIRDDDLAAFIESRTRRAGHAT
jgi:excisionase family DNA binding protein